ncbi:Chaperone protein DnaJ [subsurface metagenome]
MARPRNRHFVRAYKYYEILEVSRNATQDDIRRAYLKLAKVYHPDVNPDARAHEKFKKINEAYEILSDPTRRSSYDNSPAECPVCFTCEVIQTTEIHWRCRHCGCKFDTSRVFEIIAEVEKAAIPERLRNVVRIFQTTQCSWCKKFYTTEPFLCPFSRLRSNCINFDRLGNEERQQLLGDEKWWWRMADMIQQVQDRGIMAKCRECGALNPNPKKPVCWHCGKDTLCCPYCQKRGQNLILRYNIEGEFWKCSNAGCSKKFTIRPKKKVVEPTLSKEFCPNCGRYLYYDTTLLLWRCRNCKHIYTYHDLQSKRVRREAGLKDTGQTRPRTEQSYRPPKKPPPTYNYKDYEKPREKKGVPGCLIFFIVVSAIAILIFGVYSLYQSSNPETTEGVDTADTSDTGEQTSEDNVDEPSNVIGDYYLGLVYSREGPSTGNECYGEFIVLINNGNAVNPSYSQLITFLQQDITDQFPYQDTFFIPGFYYPPAENYIDLEYIRDIINGVAQPSDPRVCADFAERLHNEAEMAGIRCAYVEIEFAGDDYGHALNAFQTTDRGLIYIDDTGIEGYGPSNCDTTVDVQVGQQYIPISLFPEPGWDTTWGSMGIVTDILITWDGEWND